MPLLLKRRSVIPGFNIMLGMTVLYLSLIVLIPLGGLFLKTSSLSWSQIWATVASDRAIGAYKNSFGAALLAGSINAVFGLLVAWVLVRYDFFGKSIVDAMVDLPFALPTAVAGIALTAIYSEKGWLGAYLEPLGIHAAYSYLGVVIALTFIGLPFVVRTVQPVLEDLDPEVEEAAMCLGASRWNTFSKVILPTLWPALLTGFALSFARALGEYGSVIFISGGKIENEIVPLLIMTRLEEYDYAGATAIAVVMVLASFCMLLIINLLQWWSRKWQAA
jgi:sulfate/thiosulfate transport system permease protein